MKIRIIGVFCGHLAMLGLVGCADNKAQEFSPPAGGEQVTVTVKVPQDLAADTMRVMYRSQKCPIKRSGADWTSYEEDGYYPIEVVPQRQGQSDLYIAKLDRSGGGACQWNLSNVTFGVHYENTAQFGGGVKYGYGGRVIVIFDSNLPQERDMYGAKDVNGDVEIGNEYYPWVFESFILGHKKTLILLSGKSVYTYKAKSAREIYFSPRIHKEVVRTLGAKVSGGISEIIYPDGTREASRDEPDLDRLSEISRKIGGN
ncbi:hypothetical protein [Pseudomonas citronellolis]|uniref:hypothetical protein n=1 Tax=Pseudomonas citronellolis TaxID=53408 RepID=UPI0023E4208A|nr:hypothetical protein [Pseudomonas citronellolis]MDF3931163.1 hypothetical protein [Pseudomonas citronellolis]